MEVALEYARVMLGKTELGLFLAKESINAVMDGTSFASQCSPENRGQFVFNAMGTFEQGAAGFVNKK